ncbi:hypothetical protein K488DRAFT_72910 [Vararia minispora EC-137]|uniref:Uncharacterized protein n=1 Tax=Vararia minispora EC-137 TaxID=1314806 RepID=A0ACB8QCI9_9AGAM|nr:hypothetical protein K488DRAFT_72910 [Vararia minispora EC-137]
MAGPHLQSHSTVVARMALAEKRVKLSPFTKGDAVTLVLRIAYDRSRGIHMRNLRSSPDALARRVQLDLKHAEFVWRPTEKDIRWCEGTSDTIEVFWSSRAQSKLQEDLTTTAFGLYEDAMAKLGMNAMVMYQLAEDNRTVTRDSFRLWFRFAGAGEPKQSLNRLLFADSLDPNRLKDHMPGFSTPSIRSPSHEEGSITGDAEFEHPRGDDASRSPHFSGRHMDFRSGRTPEPLRSPVVRYRSTSPSARRGSPPMLPGHSAAPTGRVRTPPLLWHGTPESDDEPLFGAGARDTALHYLLDQVQMRAGALEEMLEERRQTAAEYRERAPALQKELADAERLLHATEACEGRLRTLAQKIGVGDALQGDRLGDPFSPPCTQRIADDPADTLRSFELRLRMLKEKVALEEKLQCDAEANLERERERHQRLLAEFEHQQQQQFVPPPGFGMPGLQGMPHMPDLMGPSMQSMIGPQFFGPSGPRPTW